MPYVVMLWLPEAPNISRPDSKPIRNVNSELLMAKPHIICPIPTGSGSYVLHKIIEAGIENYCVHGYNPYLTLAPPVLSFLDRSEKPLAVHTTPDYALFFRRKSIPLILTVHHIVLDHYMQKYSTLPQRIHYKTNLRWFIKASLEMADVVTCVSQFTSEMVRRELKYKRPMKVIYNGIDTGQFSPSKKSPHSGIRVLFSGNPTKRKGFHWLPAIAEKLGDGIFVNHTRGLRANHAWLKAKNVKSLGQIQSKDMPSVYRMHDILLSPTVREGFGLAIAEAMACGLPVVASNCSSIPELIDNGKGGFLCPVGDVDAFAEKINILADSLRLRQEMGEYNRAKVEKMFTVEQMVNEYKNLFEEVLG
jgi:L-malate glycosyltransferase